MAEPEFDHGYRGPLVCKIVGITYRQLDYWARTNLVRPSVCDANGSGTQRLYSYRDLVELKVIKRLLDADISLQAARKAIEYLREQLGADLASAHLVLDGGHTVLVQTGDQIVDLLRNGQGVLNIVSLGPVVNDLATDLHNVEPEERVSVRRAERDVGDEYGREIAERAIDLATLPHESVRFAHNSERQFAKLLDFYDISWEYEPRTFTLEWDRDGRPAQAFTPDFFLPAYDLYIEITTLNQKLVTKKNRKARRLREQYRDVEIRVLYQRDYLHLLVKYGLEPPSQLATNGELAVETSPLRLEWPSSPPTRCGLGWVRRNGGERVRFSPLDAQHRQLGARMVPFGGWEMPLQYSGVLEEHRACRQRAVVFDVSHLGTVEFRGAGARRRAPVAPDERPRSHRARPRRNIRICSIRTTRTWSTTSSCGGSRPTASR